MSRFRVGLTRKHPEALKSRRPWLTLALQRHKHRRHVSPTARPPVLEGTFRVVEQRAALKTRRPRAQDLGKSSNDLLGKDYPFHGTSLEVKTATPSNVTFKVAGNQNAKTNLIGGEVEAKYTDKDYGFVFTQAWTTTNVLRTQVEAENHLAQGLKFDLTTSLTPEGSGKSALVSALYKQPGLHTRAFLDLFKVRTRLPALLPPRSS